MTVLSMEGSIDDINGVMPYLRWDANDYYTGYAPLLIQVIDHGNFGGEHCFDTVGNRRCRDTTFTCTISECPVSEVRKLCPKDTRSQPARAFARSIADLWCGEERNNGCWCYGGVGAVLERLE